jgi:hypothetical protein
METRIVLAESASQTISEVVSALRSAKLKPTHQKKDWGDWIVFSGKTTVISIESVRGLTTAATVESNDEEYDFAQSIFKVFAKKGWMGEDKDGLFSLV